MDAIGELPACAARGSVGGAMQITDRFGGPMDTRLGASAQTPFVDAMGIAALVIAIVARGGAITGYRWLPVRGRGQSSLLAKCSSAAP